jgi:hypothetical protein
MIPGFLITWVTFPGVIVHELAHQLFCIWTRTRVVKVCYFRFGNPAGYVIHEVPNSTWHHILIGIGPLFVNTLLGLTLGLLIESHPWTYDENAVRIGGLWLAVSVAMHSFPSTGDARSIWHALWRRKSPFLAKLLGTPLVVIIYAGAVGSVFWLDALYGFGVAVELPKLLHPSLPF